MPTLDREFTVGPLSFQLEPGTAFVRAIRFHGHEALRGIYPAVRDEFWGTLPAGAGPAEAEIAPDLVRLRITGQLQHTATGLEWEADISARSDGTLRYHWRGRARWTFRTNRTGLCVLHPAEAAGAPCRVEHADGRSVSGWLPTAIAPHQPFTDLRAVAHTFGGGAEAIVRFEGETFEMEDQRNWSDASFKTYCRPLARPRPYEVKAGEVIEHVATLTLRGRPGVETDRAAALAPIGALPRIGFVLPGPVPAALRARVAALKPAHVRVDTAAADLAATLAWAEPEAAALGCDLELAVRGATAAAPAKLPPRCVALLFDHEGGAVAGETLAAWRQTGAGAIGTGSRHHFTELNRQRPPLDGAHALTTFGLNAQVHAFDDTSMTETVTQHAVLVAHARAIGGGRAVAVGPITLGPAADSDDPRLHTDFAAHWTRGSLAALARAGAARATYFRTHGPGGIVREASATPLEKFFLGLARDPGGFSDAVYVAGRDAIPV